MFFLLPHGRARRVLLLAWLAMSLLGTAAAGQRHRIVHGDTERPDLHALHKAQHACAAFDAATLAPALPAAPLHAAVDADTHAARGGPRIFGVALPHIVHFSARAPPVCERFHRRGPPGPRFANVSGNET